MRYPLWFAARSVGATCPPSHGGSIDGERRGEGSAGAVFLVHVCYATEAGNLMRMQYCFQVRICVAYLPARIVDRQSDECYAWVTMPIG